MEYRSDDLMALCIAVAQKHGASLETAVSLASGTIHAETSGQPTLGIIHFFDYLDALREGRLKGAARPIITRPTRATIVADGDGGIPHVAFDRVFEDLVDSAHEFGVSIFSQRNAYTCGALGYFVERLAIEGLVSIAGANSSALMAAGGASDRAVFGTNPLAFAAPRSSGRPLVIDQASSQTALVNVREAARNATAIPVGWAVDRVGSPTIDAEAALTGALLPFGGYKGANIALMVEILAAISGGNWSLDAWPFDSGDRNPSVGMFLVSIDPVLFDPNFSTRLERHLARLRVDYRMHIPGDSRASGPATTCEVPTEVFTRLQQLSF